MESRAVSILVVDDQAAFRRVAADVIEMTPGFVLAAEASHGEAALELLSRRSIDLVLMDVNMPGMGGVRTTREIASMYPSVHVVLMSSYASCDLPSDLSQTSTVYLSKENLSSEELVRLWNLRATGSTSG